MKVRINQPPPTPQPPPTYDILEVSQDDAKALIEVARRSTFVGNVLWNSFGEVLGLHPADISAVLNRLFHALERAGELGE